MKNKPKNNKKKLKKQKKEKVSITELMCRVICASGEDQGWF